MPPYTIGGQFPPYTIPNSAHCSLSMIWLICIVMLGLWCPWFTFILVLLFIQLHRVPFVLFYIIFVKACRTRLYCFQYWIQSSLGKDAFILYVDFQHMLLNPYMMFNYRVKVVFSSYGYFPTLIRWVYSLFTVFTYGSCPQGVLFFGWPSFNWPSFCYLDFLMNWHENINYA